MSDVFDPAGRRGVAFIVMDDMNWSEDVCERQDVDREGRVGAAVGAWGVGAAVGSP